MNNKAFENFKFILEFVIKYFKWIVCSAIILILASGIYRVESNEVAVVLRFGKLLGNTQQEQLNQPGLHLSLPFIIDEVIKIPVGKVHETTMDTYYGNGGNIDPDVTESGYVLTGDNNIVLMKVKIKYIIIDPIRYALYISNVGETINGIVGSQLNSFVSCMDVDTVLTNGKATLAHNIKNNSQELLNKINCGVSITNIELTEVVPPTETKKDFEAVTTAIVKKETLIQTSKQTASKALISAEATAKSLVETSKSSESSKIAGARNEVAQFDGLLKQYNKNPEVVYDGIFRQRISDLLTKMGAVVTVPEDGKAPIVALP